MVSGASSSGASSSRPSGIVVLDEDGAALWWDPDALTLLGLAPDASLARQDPLDLRQALGGPEGPNPTYRLVARPDGGQAWLRVELRPLEDGRVAALLSDPNDEPAGRPDDVLLASENRLRKILQSINDTITILDGTGRTIEGTGTVTSILGYPVSFWGGRNIFDLLHPDDLAKAAELFAEVTRSPGNRASSELRIRDASGAWQVIEGTGVNLLDDPDVGGILVTTRNITERKRTEELVVGQGDILRLVARGERCRTTLAAIAELVESQVGSGRCGVVVTEPSQPPEVASTGGKAPRSLLVALSAVLHPASAATRPHPGAEPVLVARSAADAALGQLGAQLERSGWGSCWSMPVTSSVTGLQHACITCLFETDHVPTAWEHKVAVTAADLVSIALEREWSHRQLADLAFYDELTGLANRLLLANRLEQAVFRARRHGNRVALMFMDLDRFKVINDTLGHEAGDQVLREFGERLRQSVRPEDTVARFGGDEFVVLVEGVHGDEEVSLIAERLEHSLDEPFLVGGGLYVTASVGVVVSEGADDSAATLLRDADTAMYRAKEQGRNRLEVFDERVRSNLVARMRLESELRRALDRGELGLRYQPTLHLGSGEVVGVEALVHWRHPERGQLDAGEFLDVAEQSGLSVPLGAWVLDRALADVETAGGPPLALTVTMSPRQLSQPDLATRVDEALDRYGRPAAQLVIALAEPVGVGGETARSNLARLAQQGVALAVDDFGTGRSSVSLLDGPPGVALVRISATFLARMLGSPQTEPLVRAVVDVAHALGMSVLADGVTSPEQLASLRAMSCDLGQGPAFSDPVAAAQLASIRAEH
ncbi:MAG: EAL domain-containing protein [Acidimicrobiia bacterium]|nr:EAL domain-containing protein [Acidimicrobiia bacterium]